MALRGGHMLDLDYLKSNGREGVCVSYDPAIALQRKLYLCPLFQRPEQGLSTMIRQAARLPHSKWKLLTSWEDFFKYRSTCQSLQCVALAAQASLDIAQGDKHIFSKQQFQDKFLSRLAIAARNLCSKQQRRNG